MRHSQSLIIIGIILILLPILGFPTWWKNFFIGISGLALCGVAFSFNRNHNRFKKVHHKNGRHIFVTSLEGKDGVSLPSDLSVNSPTQITPNAHEQIPNI